MNYNFRNTQKVVSLLLMLQKILDARIRFHSKYKLVYVFCLLSFLLCNYVYSQKFVFNHGDFSEKEYKALLSEDIKNCLVKNNISVSKLNLRRESNRSYNIIIVPNFTISRNDVLNKYEVTLSSENPISRVIIYRRNKYFGTIIFENDNCLFYKNTFFRQPKNDSSFIIEKWLANSFKKLNLDNESFVFTVENLEKSWFHHFHSDSISVTTFDEHRLSLEDYLKRDFIIYSSSQMIRAYIFILKPNGVRSPCDFKIYTKQDNTVRESIPNDDGIFISFILFKETESHSDSYLILEPSFANDSLTSITTYRDIKLFGANILEHSELELFKFEIITIEKLLEIAKSENLAFPIKLE